MMKRAKPVSGLSVRRRQAVAPPNRKACDGGRPHQRTLLRVCGLAAVAALCARDPDRIERLYFEPRLRGEVGPICAALARAHKPYREVEAAELARIAGTVLHGGVAVIARPRPLAVFDAAMAPAWARDGKPLVVLDGVGNPHNLGAIVRTAAFFGVERILLADRPEQALPSDASYRVAEGGLDQVTLYRAPLPQALAALRQSYRIVGTALGRGVPLAAYRGAKPTVLVLGNEEQGLGAATFAACDELVTIPGAGRVQSLNVAAAAAILLYALTGGGS
jgi:RNA methyltransferase, TrmH family